MRGLINDLLRWLIGLGIKVLGLCFTITHRIKIFAFFWNQRWLQWRYKISPDTPVLGFCPDLERRIQDAAERVGTKARFAMTSGSTDNPKRILFTRNRLRTVRLAYSDMFTRFCWSSGIKRTSLYVFSSFDNDNSLTSLLLEEKTSPPYVSSLQAPYRIQYHPTIRSLVAKYGATAVRLWILAIANPGILYSTNPSTLSSFLEEIASDWSRSSRLIKDWYEQPTAFDPAIASISRRLASSGSTGRIRKIATSDSPLPLRICAPAIHVYICWTGGYVQPFLERIADYLPGDQYKLLPMYSMSTETIETVADFRAGTLSFLPLASRVFYEFLEDDDPDIPEKLLNSDQLKQGKRYSMVVSDPYGLRRYQTEDLFLCRRHVNRLPDLNFVARRGLTYSFTGEKLTADHVIEAFQRLRSEHDSISSDKFLTCIPGSFAGQSKPHYKLVVVERDLSIDAISGDMLAQRFDELLREVNCEYESKRQSGRLAPARFLNLPFREFVETFARGGQHQIWESQFKFLPFYNCAWQQVGFTQRRKAVLPRSG